VPVIAAVNGYALGGGLALMASCDMVVASDNARFSLPEVKVGVMGGTRHLRRIVPDKVVRMMAFTGKPVDAQYFHALGVIHEVVPQAQLMEAATRLALSICEHSPQCIELMKETINLTEHMDLDEGYHVECYATSIIKATPQAHEAVQAVLEKRKPDFGRR
jgi:enoyl-CoA hydratase